MFLHTGSKGTSLREIIRSLGNKDYSYIECRCQWTDSEGQECDEFMGACQYIDGTLKALDGDTYSLHDLYIKWEEAENDGQTILTVWEYGELSDSWDL